MYKLESFRNSSKMFYCLWSESKCRSVLYFPMCLFIVYCILNTQRTLCHVLLFRLSSDPKSSNTRNNHLLIHLFHLINIFSLPIEELKAQYSHGIVQNSTDSTHGIVRNVCTEWSMRVTDKKKCKIGEKVGTILLDNIGKLIKPKLKMVKVILKH